MAKEEIPHLEAEERRLAQKVQLGLLPPDPADSRNTIIEIRAGAGGQEAALFAASLYRMYTHYAEARGWKFEDLNSNASDLGGFKEIIFEITGTDVYKRLKYESGVHRVQRVPATEAQGRIHTSTCTVAVLPEAQEVEVELKPEDLEITRCRASGPGGQGVNTTDSAVQILHKPSGMIVRCADGRSQQKNKQQAFTVLRSRLLERRIDEENAKYAAQRKAQVGTGERNERIRTRWAAVNGMARIRPSNPSSRVVPTITAIMIVSGCSPTRLPMIFGEMTSPSSVCTMPKTASTSKGCGQSPNCTNAMISAVTHVAIAPRNGIIVRTVAMTPRRKA